MSSDPNNPSDAQFVIFFVLSSISILANSLVVWSLVKLRRSATCFTHLLSYLHATTVAEQILTMPYLYKGNSTVCLIVESLHCYVSLMNIFTIAMLVETHLSTIFEDPYDLKTKIVKYGKYFFFTIPCIGFLGFVNKSFNKPHCAFCIVPSSITSLTFLFVYYLEIWIALFYSCIRMIVSFFRIYRIDSQLASRYFSSIGWYIIVALLSWLPRSIIRFTNQNAEDDDDAGDDKAASNTLFLGAFYPLVVSGLLFAIIYFREKAAIKSFAMKSRQTSALEESEDIFSWDEILAEEGSKSVSSISKQDLKAINHISNFFGNFFGDPSNGLNRTSEMTDRQTKQENSEKPYEISKDGNVNPLHNKDSSDP